MESKILLLEIAGIKPNNQVRSFPKNLPWEIIFFSSSLFSPYSPPVMWLKKIKKEIVNINIS